MGDKVSLEIDDCWESSFLPGTDNTLELSPCKNKYTFDLNLGRYRESKFQNQPFYLHFDTAAVKFFYNQVISLLN